MYGWRRSRCGFHPTSSPIASPCGPEAKFHDGSNSRPIERRYSLTVLKEKASADPGQLRDMVKAEALDDRYPRRYLSPQSGARRALYVASLPIFSGPIIHAALRRIDPRHSLARALQAWGIRSQPLHRVRTSQGLCGGPTSGLPRQLQFRRGRYEFYRDRDARSKALPARLSGTEEFTARVWATRYDFPAVKDGRVKRETLPDDTPSGAQGWLSIPVATSLGSARS